MFKKSIFLCLLALSCTGCQYKMPVQDVLEMYPDNKAEEFVEYILEDATGAKIDITGKSEE